MSGDSEGAPRLSCRVCFIQQNESLRLPSDPPKPDSKSSDDVTERTGVHSGAPDAQKH